jgi:hypothetical protein
MSTALVLHPDGGITEINLKPGVTHLALMREHIGCHLVDVVALTGKIDMWLDDESLYTQPVNPLATALARHYGFTWQSYHGPVILCSVDDEGGSIDLNAGQVRALLTRLLDAVEAI